MSQWYRSNRCFSGAVEDTCVGTWQNKHTTNTQQQTHNKHTTDTTDTQQTHNTHNKHTTDTQQTLHTTASVFEAAVVASDQQRSAERRPAAEE